MKHPYRGAGATHIGRRDSNQDAFVVRPDFALFAVADGMGGYAGGEVASALATDSISKLVGRTLRGDNLVWPYPVNLNASPSENLVASATRLADEAIVRRRIGVLDKMGSTLSLLLGCSNRVVIGHVGDSRVYRFRRGELEQLTSDHTLYAQLVAEGHNMPPAEEYPYSNVITRALGASPASDIATVAVESGDRFILCTDGLTGPLSDSEIADRCGDSAPARVCADLLDAAFEAGGRDNITVVVVDYVGGSTSP